MAEETKRNEFSFSKEEAEAAARCETGIGDLPSVAAFWIALIVLLSIAVRIIFDIPLPPMRVIGMYGVTALLWILFSIYIRHRIRITAAAIMKRYLHLVTEEERFSVYEFADEIRYHADYNEIATVEKGEYIYRITAPIGRICIPVRAMPSEMKERLESLESAEHITRRWM